MKEIPLTQGKVAIVDDEHYEYLNQWKWIASKCGGGNVYAQRTVYWRLNGERQRRTIKMHRLIAGITGYDVDHVNHNTLDNRSENLRVATKSENKMNSRSNKPTPSGFKGVRISGKKFQTRIQKDGESICVGVFPDAVIAAKAYNAMAIKLFGDRACINTIPTSSNVD